MMTNQDMTALAVSKLCHDLVNPLGALGNGVELLELTGQAGGEEMALIKQALGDATARLGFYRVAFGAGSDQLLSPNDVERVLDPLNIHARVTFSWTAQEPRTRHEVKRAFLGLMCAQSALPMGGAAVYDGQTVTARGDGLSLDPALWSHLTEGGGDLPTASSDIHFALLAQTMADQGRRADLQTTDGQLTLTL